MGNYFSKNVDRLEYYSLAIKNNENARRIAMVENCFGYSGQPLAAPGRVLVAGGKLTKMCHVHKKPKPRQFFLFNDILVYGNIIVDQIKFSKQHIIPLEAVKLEPLDDEELYAESPMEKKKWMAHTNKCIDDLLIAKGKSAIEVHAAVSVPDSDVTVCMHCRRTEFNVLYRKIFTSMLKHHCGSCGIVVCGPCSKNRIMLPDQSPKAVCLNCFDKLANVETQHNLLKERYEPTSDDELDDVHDNGIYEHVADDEFKVDHDKDIYDHVADNCRRSTTTPDQVIDYDVDDVGSFL